MKRFLLISAISFLSFLLASAGWYYSKLNKGNKTNTNHFSSTAGSRVPREKIIAHITDVRKFITGKVYNSSVCFIIDMSIESGKNRFFVYDLNKDSIIMSGLVTHGRCKQTWLTGRKYDNAMGCGCTSLGKYKVGKPYKGRFGLAYKLYGLEASNSNAYSRFVVLHSMQCVPESEVYPYPICQSDGCPTVSPGFLKNISSLINGSPKPILLAIYQ